MKPTEDELQCTFETYCDEYPHAWLKKEDVTELVNQILKNQEDAEDYRKVVKQCPNVLDHKIVKRLKKLNSTIKEFGDRKINKSDLYQYGYIMASFVWAMQIQKILGEEK